MWSYSAFGLGIRSEVPLPELTEADSADDIVIRYGHVERPPDYDPSDDDYSVLAGDTVAFHIPQGGFRIRAASELTVDPSTASSPSAVRLAILGRALGAMLQWRGLFVLHASAVARDGRVIAFVGESGSGKSTTAATFMSNGYDLVADDLVAIDTSGSGLAVRPGYGQLKLWPDAAEAHGIEHGSLARVHERHEKRIVPLAAERMAAAAMALDSIYVLATGTPTRCEVLTPQKALVELLRHAYAPRIMRSLGRQGDHLSQSTRVAAGISTASLIIDRNSRKLFDVFDVVAAHRSKV